LQGEEVAEGLEDRGRAETLHALEDDDEVSQAGTQLGVFDDFEEALGGGGCWGLGVVLLGVTGGTWRRTVKRMSL